MLRIETIQVWTNLLTDKRLFFSWSYGVVMWEIATVGNYYKITFITELTWGMYWTQGPIILTRSPTFYNASTH